MNNNLIRNRSSRHSWETFEFVRKTIQQKWESIRRFIWIDRRRTKRNRVETNLFLWITSSDCWIRTTCIIVVVMDALGACRCVIGVRPKLHAKRHSNWHRFPLLQDICGIICAVITWLLILYAEFVVMVVIIWPSPYPIYSTINMIIFNALAFLAYASHIRTMFSDPVGFAPWSTVANETIN